MDIAALLADLSRQGIALSAHGDRLNVKARAGVPPGTLRLIRSHKADLLAALAGAQSDGRGEEGTIPACNPATLQPRTDRGACICCGAPVEGGNPGQWLRCKVCGDRNLSPTAAQAEYNRLHGQACALDDAIQAARAAGDLGEVARLRGELGPLIEGPYARAHGQVLATRGAGPGAPLAGPLADLRQRGDLNVR